MEQTVTAVVTFYNNARTIQSAVGSILAQSRAPSEIIVVDDCSRPDEAAALANLPAQVVHLRTPRNGGAGAARALGTAHARSEWVAYLDGDDYWLSNKLERQLAFLADHPDLDGAHCGTIVWRNGSEGEHYIGKPPHLTARLVCEGHNILASAFIVRREKLLEIGNWCDEWFMLEDLDLAFRMMKAGLDVRFQPEALVRFRRDDHGNVTGDRWRDLELHLNCVTRHREYILSTVGEEGLRALRARYLHRFGRRHGRVAGWLIATGARMLET